MNFPHCCQPQMNPSLIVTWLHASRIEHQR